MNDVPLVKTNGINDINTSVLALKRRLMQLEREIKNISSSDDVLLRSDLVDTVEEGIEEPVTSNAVYNAIQQGGGESIPVGFILPQYKKVDRNGWLYLDGSTFDENEYPALYLYLGTNVLPDYREFGLVGAEENTTDVYDATTNPNGTIHDHDIYAEGQAKDDQMQHLHGSIIGMAGRYDSRTYQNVSVVDSGNLVKSGASRGRNGFSNNGTYSVAGVNIDNSIGARTGYDYDTSTLVGSDVTRGKRKAVYFYIKAID